MKQSNLGRAIVSKLGKNVLLLMGILVFIFVLMRAIPGDIVDVMSIEGGLDEGMKAALREELGLNKSLPEQFLAWLTKMVKLDFGNSLRFGKPVLEIIGYSLPFTLRFALLSCAFGLGLGSALAFLAIWKRSRLVAALVEGLNIWSTAIPTFCIGFILIFIFVLRLKLMPLSGNLLFPVIILGLDIAGQVAKPLYAEMKDSLSSRFVTIARAKGLSYRWIVFRHVLPNSLTVFLALSGLIVAGTLGGSITMEVLFSLPGLGQLAYNSVAGRDYPIIQALALFIAVMVILVNLITDLTAMLIDPRQRDGEQNL